MNKFSGVFDDLPDVGAPKPETHTQNFAGIFDDLPTVEEAAGGAIPLGEIDAFGMVPGAMRPTDILTGAAAGGVDLAMALPKIIAGGLGEAANLPGNLQQDPSKIGEFFHRTMEAFPLEWEKWGILTPEAEAIRRSAMLPFQIPQMVMDPIAEAAFEAGQYDPFTGEKLAETSPELAAILKSSGEAAPLLGMILGAGRSVVRGGKAAGRAVVEGLPEEILFKSKAGKSWSAQEVGDILRATDESTIAPDLLQAFKDLSPAEKAAAVRGAGIDLSTVEPTWLGKLLGKEAKPPEAKPGKPEKKPPKEPPAPAPTEPAGELPPGPEPAPGGAEIVPEPPAPLTPPPDAKVTTTTFGSEVAARVAVEAYRKNGLVAEVRQEGKKWIVDRWKPEKPTDVGTVFDDLPEIGAAPSPTVPGESVSGAPPVPPQGPTEPPITLVDHAAEGEAPAVEEITDRRKKPYEGPRERRKDLATRKRIEDMTEKEKTRALMYDEVTGLKTRRAWEDAEKKPVQTAIDVHGLKWVNDNIGHSVGDQMLNAIADAIDEIHGEGYRFSGDEFVIEGDLPEQNEHSVGKIKEMLAESTLVATLPDGTEKKFQGITISHGTGGSLDEAFSALNLDKEAAIARGERSAERGGRPRKLAEIVAPGLEAPGGEPAEIPEAEVIPSDKKDETGVPSEIALGEKPVETKPDEEASGAPPVPSGILQEPRPRPVEGEEKPTVKGGEEGREEKPQEAPRPVEEGLSNKELTEKQFSIGDTVYFKTGWNKMPQKISHINSNGEIRVEGSKATYSPTEFTKESPVSEEVKEEPPVPAKISKEPEAPPHFISGMSRPADFDAAVEAGADIGVELQELSKPMIRKVGEATKTSKIFVDNGAFNAFKRQLKAEKEGKSAEEIKALGINWSKTIAKYGDLIDATVNPSNLTIVAPDVIGDPEATRKKQTDYSTRYLDWADAGVEVVWPLQRGGPIQDEAGDWDYHTTIPSMKNWMDSLIRGYSREKVGTLPDGTPSYNYPLKEENRKKVIVGIPANEKAWSPEEAGRLVKELGILRVHLLGLGPQNKNAGKYVDAMREANPDIEITTDATPSGLRRLDLAEARDEALGISDDTEIYMMVLGRPTLSESGAAMLADEIGLEHYGLDRNEFINDVFNGDVWDAMTEGEKYGALVDVPFLDQALAKIVRAENPAEKFRSVAIYKDIKRILSGRPVVLTTDLLNEWAEEWANAVGFTDEGDIDPSKTNMKMAHDMVEAFRGRREFLDLMPEDIVAALNKWASTPWTEEEVITLFEQTATKLGEIEDGKIALDSHKIAEEFARLIREKMMPKDRTQLKRYIANNLGITAAELQKALETQRADWKNVEEGVEYAAIKVAREIARDEKLTPEFKYKKIVEVYNQLPLLSQRTSDSIALQQYSTPLPIAFLMGEWVDIGEAEDVYEPTAGTGMLLIGANPDARVVANELDERRAGILGEQGYEVHTQNATHEILQELGIRRGADAVLMNPPFGTLGKPVLESGYKVLQKDHLIAMKALGAMRDDGRAAIILGGHNLHEGAIRPSDQPFLNYIYGNYNVKKNIEVDGTVYRKQGTTWPIRIILISGRKTVPTDTMIGPDELLVEPNVALYFDDVKRQMERAYDRPTGFLGGKGEAVSGAEKPARPPRAPRPSGTDRPQRDPAPTGELEPADDSGVGVSGDRPDTITSERPTGVDKRPRGGGKKGTDLAGDRGGDERPRRPDVEIEVGEHQTTYIPTSRGDSGNNKIPKRMADAVKGALEGLQKQVGDIDDFVAGKLDMPVAKMLEVLSGEQVDALALGLAQMDTGMALINGDQTGVGKGRVAAAVIRYANVQGKIPLFITAMPKLFTDMWRDLTDIGHEVKPFLMHGDRNKASVYDEEGDIVFKPHGGAKTYREMLSHPEGPQGWLRANGFGVVMLPYSQVQSPTSSLQRDVLAALGPDNYAILDESHKASGQSRIGNFFRESIVRPAKGVMYLSATYAKRPDTMSLYFRTNIGATGMPVEQLTDAIVAGGVSLQQWMANALAASGQYIRRELDFTGISFKVQTDFDHKKRDTERADRTTHVLRNILSFDRAKLDWVRELDRLEKDKERLELGGSRISGGKQTLNSGVSSTNFAATVHNAVSQLLLSIKADEAAEQAIAALKEGKKPVLNLMNTMQSFLDDLAAQENIKEGEPIEFGFHAVLKRALRNTLRLRKTDTKGNETTIHLTPEKLPEHLQLEYKRVERLIHDLSDLELPGSPIDYIINKIQKAGFKIAEITGRATKIDYSKDIPTLEKRSAKEIADRNVPVIGFQKGTIDALIINAAGSTGLSLHAAPASDKKPRIMIVLQPDLNIDTFTQALGRINRKGQVVVPEYILLASAIPAEIRPSTVLRKKMSSLNANTSANTEAGTSIDVPDMLNEYGDRVVVEFLADNSQINQMIGNPLGIGEGQSVEAHDAFRKVTGKVALAPVSIQERFYNAVQEAFLDRIEYLDQVGENNLRAKDYDLQAVPKRRVKIADGTNENNPLTASTFGDEMSVRVLKKPFNALKIKELVDKALDGRDPKDISNEIYAELERRAQIFEKELKADYDGEDLNRQMRRLHSFLERQKDVFHLPKAYEGQRWAAMRQFRIGDTFRIGLGDDYDVQGVLIGIKLPSLEAAGNPIAPSRIKLSFAVNSSIQRVDLSLSSEPAFRTNKTDLGIDRDWDENLLTSDREERVIITGNLLEGFGQITGNAQVINFTDSKGRRHDGILLPPGRSLTDLGQAVIPWDKAFDALAGAHAEGRDARMRSADAESDQVRVSWGYGEATPTLIVPLPKNRGQKYWGDADLLEMTIEKRFDKSRSYSPFMKNRMVAAITSENLKKALAMLTVKHGVRWTAPASIEEITDGELPDGSGGDTTLYSTPLDPELIKQTFQSVSKSVQELRQAHKLAKKARKTDLNWFNNTINTPYYIFSEKFPRYAPVFERAREGFQERDDISSELAYRGLDYFAKLEFSEKEAVNKALIRGRYERTVFTHEQLDAMGLTPEQKAGYFALRDMFDHALDIYEDGIIYRVTKGAVQSSSGLDLEVIGEILTQLDYKKEKAERIIELLEKIREAKRKGYAPFSRFGDWGYGLQRIKEDGTPGEIFYWATEESAWKAARAYQKLLKRYRKSIAAGTMKPIPPRELKQKEKKHLIEGVGGFELEILSRFMELEEDTAEELKQAVEHLFQASGFRKHFFESKDTPGFSTDMERASADYIIGLSGFVSRIKMIPEMDELAKGMEKFPKLALYYKTWRDYITSPHEEYHRLRSGLFLYFLGGNVKSAAINLTQILAATVPWLSQYVSNARALAETTRAAKTLISALGTKEDGSVGVVLEKLPRDVREIITRGVQEGIISEQLVYELMGVARKPSAMRKISKQKQRVVRGFGFLFSTTEKINRFVTMIAAARIHASLKQKAAAGGAAPPQEPPKGPPPSTGAPFEDDPFEFSKRAVDETQFIYSKFNRPRAFRNFGAIFGVFRTFVVNILELYARFLRRKSFRAMFAAFVMLWFLAGLKGMPFAENLKYLIEQMVGAITHKTPDLETAVREWGYDSFGSPDFADWLISGPNRSITGIDIGRSVGVGDVVPLLGPDWEDPLAGIIGAPAEVLLKRPQRAYGHVMEGDYYRAVESVAPEFLRNPMYAARLLREGLLDRTGAPIADKKDISAFDIAAKAAGFTPTSVAKAQERESAKYRIGERTERIKRDVTREAMKLANKGEYESALATIRSRAHGWRSERNRDEIIFTGKPLPKSSADWIILDEYTLIRQLEESKVGAKYRGILRQPTLQRQEYLKINKLFQ